jgi:hypothetical protein
MVKKARAGYQIKEIKKIDARIISSYLHICTTLRLLIW